MSVQIHIRERPRSGLKARRIPAKGAQNVTASKSENRSEPHPNGAQHGKSGRGKKRKRSRKRNRKAKPKAPQSASSDDNEVTEEEKPSEVLALVKVASLEDSMTPIVVPGYLNDEYCDEFGKSFVGQYQFDGDRSVRRPVTSYTYRRYLNYLLRKVRRTCSRVTVLGNHYELEYGSHFVHDNYAEINGRWTPPNQSKTLTDINRITKENKLLRAQSRVNANHTYGLILVDCIGFEEPHVVLESLKIFDKVVFVNKVFNNNSGELFCGEYEYARSRVDGIVRLECTTTGNSVRESTADWLRTAGNAVNVCDKKALRWEFQLPHFAKSHKTGLCAGEFFRARFSPVVEKDILDLIQTKTTYFVPENHLVGPYLQAANRLFEDFEGMVLLGDVVALRYSGKKVLFPIRAFTKLISKNMNAKAGSKTSKIIARQAASYLQPKEISDVTLTHLEIIEAQRFLPEYVITLIPLLKRQVHERFFDSEMKPVFELHNRHVDWQKWYEEVQESYLWLFIILGFLFLIIVGSWFTGHLQVFGAFMVPPLLQLASFLMLGAIPTTCMSALLFVAAVYRCYIYRRLHSSLFAGINPREGTSVRKFVKSYSEESVQPDVLNSESGLVTSDSVEFRVQSPSRFGLTFGLQMVGGIILLFTRVRVLVLFLVVWLLFKRPVHAATLSTSDMDWEEFRDLVSTDRVSLDVNLSVPIGAGFPGLQSWFDPYKYPQAESVKYHEAWYDPHQMPSNRNTTIIVGPMCSAVIPFTFSSTHHNIKIAIRTRVTLAMPAGDPEAWALLESLVGDLFPIVDMDGQPVANNGVEFYEGDHIIVPHLPVTWDEYVESRGVALKRRKLREGYDLYYDKAVLDKGDLNYGGFVKSEKQMVVTLDEYEPVRPRMIQGCSLCAKVLAGPWFYQLTRAYKDIMNIHSQICYSCGVNSDQINFWFNHSLEVLGGEGNVVSLFSDFSKYDVTQRELCIGREIQHYRDLNFTKWVQHGEEILAAMYRSTVVAGGIIYSVDGTRKSGDLNTSLGNTKNTAEMIVSWLRMNNLTKWRLICLGDDNMTLIDHRELLEVFDSFDEARHSIIAWATRLGYNLKALIATDLTKAEYCSARFYPTQSGYVVGKKPGRILTKISMFLRKSENVDYARLLMGVVQSYKPTGMHVPFLRVYLEVVEKHLTGVKPIYPSKDYTMADRECDCYECDEVTWAAFEQVYGFGPDDESEYRETLERNIRTLGLSHVASYPWIEAMFKIDFEL